MTASSNEPVGRRVNYRGRVQGVGFRYTTHSIARGFSVIGYVKNLRDGSVELLAVGAPGEIEAFLEEVQAAFDEHITSHSREDAAVSEELTGFEVRH